ncbi:hypothetical protein HYFRA_00009622 [Hymenoscyphus fraxineus]|uniref:SprT-like domain-containing protein n=1 Tax=Hymenoscyphus fraxineus TaxID=746836 RepID=A0A9N9KT77_9HELO|nr:hypothetical protein HYFRA_00009622 [Hymenoscyphus fraxineus]
MARLNPKRSDDESPDTGRLVKGPEKGKAVTGKQGSQRVTSTANKSSGSSRNGAGTKNEEGESLSGRTTTKPKKRVLKPKAENPLLRPLTNSRTTSTSTASEVAVRRPKSAAFVEERDSFTRPRRKEKERVVIEISESDEDTDLGGFIVSDDCVDSTFCEEEEVGIIEDDEEESFVEKKREPPKSARRLVRGRRERTPDHELQKLDDTPPVKLKTEKRELDLEFGMRNLGLGSKKENPRDTSKSASDNFPSTKPKSLQGATKSEKSIREKWDSNSNVRDALLVLDSEDESELDLGRKMKTLAISKDEEKKLPKDKTKNLSSGPPKEVDKPKKKATSESDMEDPFTLRYSPSQNKPRKITKETRFTTPPSSPELRPTSPYKKTAIIPDTPHRQSSDAFWNQEVINDWNDEYSPRKTIKPTPKAKPIDDSARPLILLPTKKSLAEQGRLIKDAKKAFSERKHAIAEAFLHELDEKITQGKVSELAKSTGGIKIVWSKKLNTTAGRANWKRETIKSSMGAQPIHRHYASIELAEKVIDDEDRLLNVIAHEFCHLANFMISNIKTNPHGKEFKAWASKCSAIFGDRGIEVTTKHSYTIDYKYIWTCEHCGLEFKRHSKSIDPKRHQCGACKNKLVQTKPVPRKETQGVSGYQAFVKEHMKIIREQNPGSPQKEIMTLVGKKYQEFKASKLGAGTGGMGEAMSSKEGTPVGDDATESVVRKLDFLDLTDS